MDEKGAAMIRAMEYVGQIFNPCHVKRGEYRRIAFGGAALFFKRFSLTQTRRLKICGTAERNLLCRNVSPCTLSTTSPPLRGGEGDEQPWYFSCLAEQVGSFLQSKCNSALRWQFQPAVYALVLLLSFFALTAEAHIGSPDVFYDGMAGPYSTRVTIRMPTVVPGRAEISVRVQTSDAVEVSFLPVYSWTPITNTPPADIGKLVLGETNLYSGELWLMTFGAYSVEVHVKGPQGNGVVQIPVNSLATRQLPLPSLLGKILLLLAAVLVVGGIGIAAAAARDAALPAGTQPGTSQRWKGILAAAAVFVLFAAALVFGKHWWNLEEKAFRKHLVEGPWPDLAADIRMEGSERILRLTVGKEFFQHNEKASLIPDHGKLMHLFLVREGGSDAFAHLHPIKKKDYTFDVAIPPLPDGRYDMFCDLTFEGGKSSTATNSIVLAPLPEQSESSTETVERDPDDSWATIAPSSVPAADIRNPIFHLRNGGQVEWKCQKPLRANQDASLRFSVTDSAGNPMELEPYMGMLCHAAVLRSDGSVFAHLHPSGNFSMAAQMFFADKMTTSGAGMGDMGDMANMPGMDHSMHQMHHVQSGGAASEVYLPYEFPVPGDYRIWAQFKMGGRVVTAVFDAHVGS